MKLKDAVGLDCYHKRDEAILSGTKAGDCLYSAGNRNFLYINSNGRNVFRLLLLPDFLVIFDSFEKYAIIIFENKTKQFG